MPLLKLNQLSLHYGQKALLDQIDLSLYKANRIGILGRNGEGKTTLLKIIAGDITADSGERWVRPGVKISWLAQELPGADNKSVYDVVASGLAEVGEWLAKYHALISDRTPDLKQLEKVQHRLEAMDGWRLQQKVDVVLSQLQLQADLEMSSLSGGWRRRVALAKALVSEPDVLLLDEPTNHLDIPSIEWLERQIIDFSGAVLLITHDRAFLQRVANQIVELDRGELHPWQGDYQSFVVHRQDQMAVEERHNALFDKRLAEEEKWIRQGIKARRTRNEGRVRALEAMREERSGRRERQGKAGFAVDSGDRSGKLVTELRHVSHSFGGQRVIDDLSTVVMRGDRIGLIGPNGAGKSTLLKIILGELSPQQGQVHLGTKLDIAYFDQLREQLDPEKNLLDNICEGREFLTINGKERHGISYLADFLFAPDRIRTPVKALSGGEQNRAILAKLFSKPANLLVLDEPTNDLDIETLELLEEILVSFDGTILLVSHDRAFMDNVVTSILVFEGDGIVTDHVGGYSDWIAKGGSLVKQREALPPVDSGYGVNSREAEAIVSPSTGPRKKLSYKAQRELDALPIKIEELEAAVSELEDKISEPGFYQQDSQSVEDTLTSLSGLQEQLEDCLARWIELEA
jgi:ABC transport system ATP-binding/permease protein